MVPPLKADSRCALASKSCFIPASLFQTFITLSLTSLPPELLISLTGLSGGTGIILNVPYTFKFFFSS